MNPETVIQNKIEVSMSQLGAIPYRMQVGNFVVRSVEQAVQIYNTYVGKN